MSSKDPFDVLWLNISMSVSKMLLAKLLWVQLDYYAVFFKLR
jgi:hypothetical protein